MGGTAVSPDGATLAVFHRAERVWTEQSYSGELFQHMTNTTSISHDTVMLVDRLTGSVTAQWGACGKRKTDANYLLSSSLVSSALKLWALIRRLRVALHRAQGVTRFPCHMGSPSTARATCG